MHSFGVFTLSVAALLFIVPRSSEKKISTLGFVRPNPIWTDNISSTDQFQNTDMRDPSRRVDFTLKYLATGTDVRVISRVMQMSSLTPYISIVGCVHSTGKAMPLPHFPF